MANWNTTLNISAEWQQASDRIITAQELAKVIADKLRALPIFTDEYVNEGHKELIEQFSDFATDEDADFDDLDYLLNDLYDWADQRLDDNWNGSKVCWVKTF